MSFNTDAGMQDMFDQMFGGKGFGFGDTENEATNLLYKEVKAKSSLKLCQMKSGCYKILNYYDVQVGETYTEVMVAKRAFIKIHKG